MAPYTVEWVVRIWAVADMVLIIVAVALVVLGR